MERWSGGDVSSVYRGRMEGRGGVGTARVVGKGAIRISENGFPGLPVSIACNLVP